MEAKSPPLRSDTALLGGLYTLTSTHCGTGQAAGAIDLPVARESHTGLPVIPASSLKGVAKDEIAQSGDGGADTRSRVKDVKDLFGADTEDTQLKPGKLSFTEGRLVALPVRSLNRPFLYATSPLLLERLKRDMDGWGIDGLFPAGWVAPKPDPQRHQAQVADPALAGVVLVAEDLIYQAAEVGHLPMLAGLGENLKALLPADSKATGERLARDLVVLPDQDLCDLANRTLPVQARIQLTAGKTTSRYLDDDGEWRSGNLWYEETLPPDCLFVSFVVARDARRTRRPSGETDAGSANGSDPDLDRFLRLATVLQHVQIGGNKTVGQGWCWWTFPAAAAR